MKIGVDIGGMSIKLGLVNAENQIVAKESIPTEPGADWQVLCEKMAEKVAALLQAEKLTLEECDGIGIGCAGTIDDQNGIVKYSNNLGWKEVPLVDELKRHMDTVIRIANDADAAALGEVCAGAAQGTLDAVLLTLGTGVGGGVIMNRKIFHGPLTGGCELGHSVIVYNGEQCTCGRKGCLEAYASASALLRIAREQAGKHPESLMNEMCHQDLSQMTGKIPFDASEKGDEAARKAVEEYQGYLACGIANVINTFRPAKVILGGGVAAQKENLTRPLQKMVNTMCFGGEVGQVSEIVTSDLGNDAGIIGAANLV